MTTIQAIDAVKMLLDETGREYYSQTEILLALEQAQIEKARDYWARGVKEALRPLFTRVPLAGDGVAGIDYITLTAGSKIMYLEALLVKMKDIEPAPLHSARYIPPDKFIWHRFPNPSGRVSGRLEYTLIGGLIYHNGAGTLADLSFLRYPFIATQNDNILLAPFTHQAIVDRAAYLLYRKEAGGQDHNQAGSNADLQLIDQAQKQRAQATAARQVLRQRYKSEFQNEPESELP